MPRGPCYFCDLVSERPHISERTIRDKRLARARVTITAQVNMPLCHFCATPPVSERPHSFRSKRLTPRPFRRIGVHKGARAAQFARVRCHSPSHTALSKLLYMPLSDCPSKASAEPRWPWAAAKFGLMSGARWYSTTASSVCRFRKATQPSARCAHGLLSSSSAAREARINRHLVAC